jgi:hypothetical protein
MQGKHIDILLDTGADLSVIERASLNPAIKYTLKGEINIRGISNTLIKTEGTMILKLFTNTHETTHKFHVVGEEFEIHYDRNLGRDFFEDKQSVINYCVQQIIMGDVVVKFDPKPDRAHSKDCKLTLRARSENIVKLPSESLGDGLISKRRIMPGVFLAESLTKAINWKCVTSIVNTLEQDIILDPPQILLEAVEDNEEAVTVTNTAVPVEVTGRLSKLREELRTDHLNDEVRVSLVKICEEYNDIFHLPGDTLTCSTAAEHATPTPTIDPSRAINTKSYRIPEIHKDEVKRQIEQMLKDNIIQPSNRAWNSPILIIPKKADASGKQKWRIVVDFRRLNDVTVGDSFPLHMISEILDTLGNSKYFSTIDLASGFLQIPVKVEDRPKTAFSAAYQDFEYKQMPMGLKGSPFTFQRLMSAVLSGIQGLKCLVYLDDIVTLVII